VDLDSKHQVYYWNRENKFQLRSSRLVYGRMLVDRETAVIINGATWSILESVNDLSPGMNMFRRRWGGWRWTDNCDVSSDSLSSAWKASESVRPWYTERCVARNEIVWHRADRIDGATFDDSGPVDEKYPTCVRVGNKCTGTCLVAGMDPVRDKN